MEVLLLLRKYIFSEKLVAITIVISKSVTVCNDNEKLSTNSTCTKKDRITIYLILF